MKNSMTMPMTHSGNRQKRNGLAKVYDNLLAEFKREQTGYATIAIIAQSCIGSIAAMLVLMNGIQSLTAMVLLFLVTILCMAYNGAVLAQLSSKVTLNLLLSSLIFNCIIIIAHLF